MQEYVDVDDNVMDAEHLDCTGLPAFTAAPSATLAPQTTVAFGGQSRRHRGPGPAARASRSHMHTRLSGPLQWIKEEAGGARKATIAAHGRPGMGKDAADFDTASVMTFDNDWELLPPPPPLLRKGNRTSSITDVDAAAEYVHALTSQPSPVHRHWPRQKHAPLSALSAWTCACSSRSAQLNS